MEEAAELSWKLCQTVSTRSYPLFQSKAEVKREYSLRFRETHGALLGCFSGGTLTGVCGFFAIPSDRYLQTVAFYIERDCQKAADGFLAYFKENYPGYSVNVGIPFENTAVAEALQRNGFDLTEDSYDMRLAPNDFTRDGRPKEPVLRLAADQYAEYAKFHDRHFPDIYWNAERLLADIAGWRIFVHRSDGGIDGSAFATLQSKTAELFGLWAPGEETARALLYGSVEALIAENARLEAILFFVDESEKYNLTASRECGFLCKGHYRLWSKTYDR